MIVTGVVPEIVPQPHTVTTNAPDGDSGAHPDAASNEKPRRSSSVRIVRETTPADPVRADPTDPRRWTPAERPAAPPPRDPAAAPVMAAPAAAGHGGGTSPAPSPSPPPPGHDGPGKSDEAPGHTKDPSTLLPRRPPLPPHRSCPFRRRAARNGSSMSTMNQLTTSASVSIDAPVQEVWAAITTPATIKQWFFGVDTESDWEVGSSWSIAASGRASRTRTRARSCGSTHRSCSSTRTGATHPEPPTAPSRTRRSPGRSRNGRGTQLTVSERNLPSEEAKQVSDQSWTMVLGNLKQLLER